MCLALSIFFLVLFHTEFHFKVLLSLTQIMNISEFSRKMRLMGQLAIWRNMFEAEVVTEAAVDMVCCTVVITVITRFSSRKSKSNPWFTSTLSAFKSTVRHTENFWKRTHSALYWSAFKSLRNRYHNLILASKKTILHQLLIIPDVSGKL